MKIRRAGSEDIVLLSEIIRNSYRTVAERFGLTPDNCPKHPSNCSDQWITADLNRGVRYFLLEVGGKAIACAAMETANESTCYLERLAVVPGYRGRGVGTTLARHILGLAMESGLSIVSIGIIAEQHDLASWYRNLGFKTTGTKQFDHLPFEVMFMQHTLENQTEL